MQKSKIINTVLLSVVFALLFYCKMDDKEEKARNMSFVLLNKIEKGTALDEFPAKNFSREEGQKILDFLKDYCDFKNREELFYGESYHKNLTGPDQVAFIHEYRLRCEDIRLILIYNLAEDAELFGFKVEPVKKFNPKVEAVKRNVKK